MNFEDLLVRKDSVQLFKDSVGLCKDDSVPGALKSDLMKTTLSLSSRIANGFEMYSKTEFIRALEDVKATCGVTRSLLEIVKSTSGSSSSGADQLIERSKKLSAMLYKFIRTKKEGKSAVAAE